MLQARDDVDRQHRSEQYRGRDELKGDRLAEKHRPPRHRPAQQKAQRAIGALLRDRLRGQPPEKQEQESESRLEDRADRAARRVPVRGRDVVVQEVLLGRELLIDGGIQRRLESGRDPSGRALQLILCRAHLDDLLARLGLPVCRLW